MLASRLEIQRLQNELRGCAVTSARRSVGNCILLDFKARSNSNDIRTRPGMLVELATWEIRWRNMCAAMNGAQPRVVETALAKLLDARIVDARISDDGIRLTFDKPLSLCVSTLTSGELGPGWETLDQWVLFGIRNTICQPINGRIARACNPSIRRAF